MSRHPLVATVAWRHSFSICTNRLPPQQVKEPESPQMGTRGGKGREEMGGSSTPGGVIHGSRPTHSDPLWTALWAFSCSNSAEVALGPCMWKVLICQPTMEAAAASEGPESALLLEKERALEGPHVTGV